MIRNNNNHNNEWLILSNLNRVETNNEFVLLMSILSETLFITHINTHLNKFGSITLHPFEKHI